MEKCALLIINPKRVNEDVEVKPFWYNYYAGYSHTFTKGIIESANLKDEAIILDPWNGTGTTTLTASVSGFKSVGLDLNPVMKVIAKAKQATRNDLEVVAPIVKRIKMDHKFALYENDLLLTWFDLQAVRSFRTIEKWILNGCCEFESTLKKVNSFTSAQCLMYTALFNCIRDLLSSFIPSNPTWIKQPDQNEEKISLTWNEIKSAYKTRLKEMSAGLCVLEHSWSEDFSNIMIGSSTKIPLPSESVDLVLTSPPYCTRIDYGVATLPELSLLCVNGAEEVDSIRRALMGTTTVPKVIDTRLDLGLSCRDFLKAVSEHSSKASKTYYYKNLVQYFCSLKESLIEVERVLKEGSRFVCVVQDSYYKNLHCDLPCYVMEMCSQIGMSLVENVQFESKQNMANVNKRSKAYRASSVAFESVLIFEKKG